MNTSRPVTFRQVLESLISEDRTHDSILRDFCKVVANTFYHQDGNFMKYYHFPEAEGLAFVQAMKLLREETAATPYTDLLGCYFLSLREAPLLNYKSLSDAVSQIVDTKTIYEMRFTALQSIQSVLDLAQQVREIGEYEDVDLLRMSFYFKDITECHIAYINSYLWGIPASARFYLDGELENLWTTDDWFRVGEEQRQASKCSLRFLEQIQF